MYVRVPLFALERSWLFQLDPGITTITYFDGSIEDVAPKIKDRFRAAVDANPWLAGKLVYSRKPRRLQLVYPARATMSDDALEALFHVNPPGLELHAGMPYTTLGTAAASATVQNANPIFNKPRRIARLTLTADPRARTSKFALVLSMSHIAGDGYTYYRILNMLSSTGKIASLNPMRKTEAIPGMADAIGREAWRFLRSAAHGCNALRGIVSGRKARAIAYYIDAAKIDALKAEAISGGEVDFVSTNDILTASFSNFIDARVSMMAINFRNRLRGIEDTDAGNYESVVFYDKAGYTRPATVRKCLLAGPPYVGWSRALPGFFEGALCRLGLITNWASFAEELVIGDCEALLHLPLYALGLLPYEVAIIFRPKRGKLGVIYATKRFGHAQFTSGRLPIGVLVSKEIFN